MQQITIDINNPKIENFLYSISKSRNKTVENIVYDIILQYFEFIDKKENNKKTIDINKFSFLQSIEACKNYKGSLSDSLIEERRMEV